MNEMRRDPVTGKWVIIEREVETADAIERIRAAVREESSRRAPGPCDFCPGNEHLTRPAIIEFVRGEFHRDHSPDWNVRVIPNRLPVFRIEGNVNRRLRSMYDVMDAVGAHEMVIETRRHADWDEISAQEVADILRTHHQRMNDLSRDERFGHLFIYKNWGPSSGTLISHPHSTVIASPSVPERIRRELDSTGRHYRMKERCLFCDIISDETRRKNDSGLVHLYDHFVTISPFFGSHPFETWVLPRHHNSDFRTLQPEQLVELAGVLRDNLARVKAIVGPLSYSLLLFTRPNKAWGVQRAYWATIDEDYHWHFKFLPRFPRITGFHRSFGVGSSYMINQVPPEIAAAMLRG
jgi:UDPglucose--hexose-1-phosphate uridylyltransferase